MAAGIEADTSILILQIRLFGPLDVLIDGSPMPPLRARKLQWLLALLVLRANREVDRTWLAGTLWPDSEQSRALFNLRQSLPPLRQALGVAASRLTSPTAHTLCLDLNGAGVDVLEFDVCVRKGDLASLEQAISLYRGPFLEGCTEEWALQERQVREQSYMSALERLADAELARGNSSASVGYLRSVIGLEPYRESAHRSLMQTLVADGDYAAAMQVYRELRLLVHEQLNARPDAQTAALYERLQQEARDRAAESSRLSCRSAPPIRAAVLPSQEAPLTNLPTPLTAFIGQSREIAELKALLRPEASPRSLLASSEILPASDGLPMTDPAPRVWPARLVTLTGVGGCGKTRLACEVATTLQSDYADGIWLVELAALTDEALVCQTVAKVLGLREESGRPLQQTLVRFLKPKRLLLILDNCEHLIDACAHLAEALLEQCPHLTILATSRSTLNIDGETLRMVPSLPTPDLQVIEEEKDLLAVVFDYDACRLFVECARRHRADLALTRQSAASVARICRCLDGIPLAIELAAARVRTLSVEQIEEGLDDRLRWSGGGRRTALPRHQTIQALIRWSWDLLDAQEQILLRRLSVFAGGWTLEAAETVCTDDKAAISGQGAVGNAPQSPSLFPLPSSLFPDDVPGLLMSLVDKSLVVYEERERQTRYRLLETVRQFVSERLAETGETAEVWIRHRVYFMTLAEAAERKLSSADHGKWLNRLEEEHDNLRAGLDRCLFEADYSGSLRLCGALSFYWETRGHLSEGREWCKRILSKAEGVERTRERAKVLNGAGILAWMQSDYVSARAYHEESLSIKREIGDRNGIAASLNNLGNVAQHQGDYVAARAYHEESLVLKREIGDFSQTTTSLLNLGAVAYQQGDYTAAQNYLEQSLAIGRESEDLLGIARALNNLGTVAQIQGNYASAQLYHEESLSIKRQLGDRFGTAGSLINMGLVAYNQGNYALAGSYYEESLAIRRELGDWQGISLSLNNLGNVVYNQGDYASARNHYMESLAIRREIGDMRGIAMSLTNVGLVAQRESDYVLAWACHKEGLTIQSEIGDRAGIAETLEAIAGLAARTGKTAHAAVLWGAADALREEIGSPLPPCDLELYDHEVAAARQALGEAPFSAAWACGCAMTLDQAISYALETQNC